MGFLKPITAPYSTIPGTSNHGISPHDSVNKLQWLTPPSHFWVKGCRLTVGLGFWVLGWRVTVEGFLLGSRGPQGSQGSQGSQGWEIRV